MKKQLGLSLTGMILACAVLFMLLLLAFKVVPVYVEYFTIEEQMKAMALDPKIRSASRQQINSSWAARAAVDNLTSLDPNNIEVDKTGEPVVVSAEYAVKVPLFKNVAACFDFKPSSK